MSEIVTPNDVASRPPDLRRTGTPTIRAIMQKVKIIMSAKVLEIYFAKLHHCCSIFLKTFTRFLG